jgi:hypothetical protein
LTISHPTITGVSAFWWQGKNVLSDYGYYAQSALTANPFGAYGSPYWSVQTSGGGSVTLATGEPSAIASYSPKAARCTGIGEYFCLEALRTRCRNSLLKHHKPSRRGASVAIAKYVNLRAAEWPSQAGCKGYV